MIKVVYKKNDQPIALWVTGRELGNNVFQICTADEKMLKVIVTSHRVHSWLKVKLAGVEFRTISAIQVGVFRSPQLEAKVLAPFRDNNMIYPPGDQAFWKSIHILADAENDNIPDPNSKIYRPGLWYSALFGGGTILGYQNRIYIIPQTDQFSKLLRQEGAKAFSKYESFEDPTLAYTDEKGLIQEPGAAKPSSTPDRKTIPPSPRSPGNLGASRPASGQDKKSACFIATACFDSPNCDQISILRNFRDERLISAPLGKFFINLYYQVSPPIAKFIREVPALKWIIRHLVLEPFVNWIKRGEPNGTLKP